VSGVDGGDDRAFQKWIKGQKAQQVGPSGNKVGREKRVPYRERELKKGETDRRKGGKYSSQISYCRRTAGKMSKYRRKLES